MAATASAVPRNGWLSVRCGSFCGHFAASRANAACLSFRGLSRRASGIAIFGMTDYVLGDIETIIPHSEFGEPLCCGCLFGRSFLDYAVIACNECTKIVRRVPARHLQKVLNEMESELEVATGLCRHCGSVNLIPGFSRAEAFVCQTCGKGNG